MEVASQPPAWIAPSNYGMSTDEEELFTFKGHTESVSDVAYLPDGRARGFGRSRLASDMECRHRGQDADVSR